MSKASHKRYLIRLAVERKRAIKAQRYAEAVAADDGQFPMRPAALELARAALRHCIRRYEKANAAWVAAGCPDVKGVKHPERAPRTLRLPAPPGPEGGTGDASREGA